MMLLVQWQEHGMTFFCYYSLLRDWLQIIHFNYGLSVSLMSTYKQ